MEVDTEDPEPGPAPEMPRRTAYGNEIDDDREYQDDMKRNYDKSSQLLVATVAFL
jgi:hypothetical protein